jgi:hypothetical protein
MEHTHTHIYIYTHTHTRMHVCIFWLSYKYVGESKIIRTVGTCFVVGYTADWA